MPYTECALHFLPSCAVCSPDPATQRSLRDVDSIPIPGYVAHDANVRYTQRTPTPVQVAASVTVEPHRPVSRPVPVTVTRMRLAPVRRWTRTEFTKHPLSPTRAQYDGVSDMRESVPVPDDGSEPLIRTRDARGPTVKGRG